MQGCPLSLPPATGVNGFHGPHDQGNHTPIW